jgi:hypothetical protein
VRTTPVVPISNRAAGRAAPRQPAQAVPIAVQLGQLRAVRRGPRRRKPPQAVPLSAALRTTLPALPAVVGLVAREPRCAALGGPPRAQPTLPHSRDRSTLARSAPFTRKQHSRLECSPHAVEQCSSMVATAGSWSRQAQSGPPIGCGAVAVSQAGELDRACRVASPRASRTALEPGGRASAAYSRDRAAHTRERAPRPRRRLRCRTGARVCR